MSGRPRPWHGVDADLCSSHHGAALRGCHEEWRTGTNRFDRPDEALFGAWAKGQLVGVCGLNIDPYRGDDRVGRVRHLYVLSATLERTRPTKENTVSNPTSDKVFAGSIPRLYETHLVPLIFEPYAEDLSGRVAARSPSRVLEIAAGTGVVTRRLAAALPERASIVATDLNQAMLDVAAGAGTRRPVEWRQADAMQLPFENEAFETVVCQFGVMFFPDKARAFSEARRVLRPGGAFLFSVWDRIEDNEFALVVTTALESLFPVDPPRFLARTPHGYHDVATIERDLRQGGFSAPPRITTVAGCSRADSPRMPAIAFCQGTPLRSEIEARDGSRLGEATDRAADAIAARFGAGRVEGKMQAHIVAAER